MSSFAHIVVETHYGRTGVVVGRIIAAVGATPPDARNLLAKTAAAFHRATPGAVYDTIRDDHTEVSIPAGRVRWEIETHTIRTGVCMSE
jgi:hypothetical protein